MLITNLHFSPSLSQNKLLDNINTKFISGVFVRIKDKNLHVECFKCATCGTSLKNQGYFNLHNKLYCDVHARMAALSSPPPSAKTNGLMPVTFPPWVSSFIFMSFSSCMTWKKLIQTIKAHKKAFVWVCLDTFFCGFFPNAQWSKR